MYVSIHGNVRDAMINKQMKIMLKVTSRDKNGKIVSVARKRAGYLLQWGATTRQIFNLPLAGNVGTTCKDITNTNRDVSRAHTGPNECWMCVGTSAQAATVADYNLIAEIGTVIASLGALANVGTGCRFNISGTYTWVAGGTVNEVGVKTRSDYIGGDATFLIMRDVVTPVIVPAGGTVTTVYTLIFPL